MAAASTTSALRARAPRAAESVERLVVRPAIRVAPATGCIVVRPLTVLKLQRVTATEPRGLRLSAISAGKPVEPSATLRTLRVGPGSLVSDVAADRARPSVGTPHA